MIRVRLTGKRIRNNIIEYKQETVRDHRGQCVSRTLKWLPQSCFATGQNSHVFNFDEQEFVRCFSRRRRRHVLYRHISELGKRRKVQRTVAFLPRLPLVLQQLLITFLDEREQACFAAVYWDAHRFVRERVVTFPTLHSPSD